MIQEVLIGKFGGQYESGSLNQPKLGKQRRASILRRVYFGTQVENDLPLMQNLHCHHPDQYRRELARRLEDYSLLFQNPGLSAAARDVYAEAVNGTQESHRVHPDQLLSEVRDSKTSLPFAVYAPFLSRQEKRNA